MVFMQRVEQWGRLTEASVFITALNFPSFV